MSRDKLFVEIDANGSIGKAYGSHQDMYDENYGCQRTVGGIGRTFENWDTNLSIKSDYGREDYNFFREREATPSTRLEILRYAQKAYDKVGVVHNVIDLMSDFGAKGARLTHPIPSVQRFYQTWWKKIHGFERTERFLNSFYRLGVTAVYRSYGKMPKSKEKEYKSVGARQIPIKYSFINPETLSVFGESIASFVTNSVYVVNLPTYIHDYVQGYSGEERERILYEITKDLAPDIREAIINRKPHIVLDQDRLSVFHYKKDDWHTWGKPITYSIMDDLVALEKLKLADISALDGAISNVRLWRIGRLTDNPATTILPTKTMINKLRSIIDNNLGGGTLDLVWGPELDFKESSSNIYQFLGQEKYKPTLDAIYDGLGIPVVLRGDSDSATGTDFVSLKTLIERLNYGRSHVVEFWENELNLIQKVMGFSRPATIEFDHMVLTDEAVEKQLLINLADRDIISHDTVRERFGINPEIEESKIKREYKNRGKNSPDKAGPFHTPEKIHEYKKLLLSGGTVTPSELGIELEPRKKGETSKMDQQLKYASQKNKQSGENGRPPNIVETQKREPKKGDNMRIARSKQLMSWCNTTQEKVSEFITKAVLSSTNTKNIRSLTGPQKESLERFKAHCLFNISPFSEVNEAVIYEAFAKEYNKENADDIEQILSLNTTVEHKRQSLAMLYFLNYADF